MKEINSFRNEYSFLSNFSKYPVKYKNILFRTSEHAFQWAKAESEDDKTLILKAYSPVEAKSISKRFKFDIKKWEEIKISIMNDILESKFKNPDLKSRLLKTKDLKIVEGNYWHDNFWGECSCNKCKNKPKYNNLGKILMKIRDDIK